MSSDERCGLDEEAYARLLAELDLVEPRLAVATCAAQERLLDEAFERAGLDPDWATWQAVAREHLPAYRQGRGGDTA